MAFLEAATNLGASWSALKCCNCNFTVTVVLFGYGVRLSVYALHLYDRSGLEMLLLEVSILRGIHQLETLLIVEQQVDCICLKGRLVI